MLFSTRICPTTPQVKDLVLQSISNKEHVFLNLSLPDHHCHPHPFSGVGNKMVSVITSY